MRATGRACAAVQRATLSDIESQRRSRRMARAVAYGVAAVVDDVPLTYAEAMASSEAAQWLPSMQREIASCEEQHTWTLVRRADLHCC
jgi:hypothetical protein